MYRVGQDTKEVCVCGCGGGALGCSDVSYVTVLLL